MPDFAERLQDRLPAGRVVTTPEVLAAYSRDKWFASNLPDAVVLPEATADVAATLRFAHENQIPVTARGAGYGYVGGCVPSRGGIVIALAQLDRVKEIHVPDGVAIVEPGVVTAELQRQARARGPRPGVRGYGHGPN